jgi:predicted DCC family thiol-disulfide oxidoreductase YuxK
MGASDSLEKPYLLVLFDGYCNLCTSSVQFIIRRDRKKRFRFASLQSPSGQAVLKRLNRPVHQVNSVVLVHGDRIYTESAAALHIARHLSGAWPLLFAFIMLPAFLRDPVYRFIATNRYRWFGRRTECWMPDADLADRFI